MPTSTQPAPPLIPLPATRHLILGGQKSGKTRHAEHIAGQWLQSCPPGPHPRHALYVATAQAQDAEMHARIARHQHERALRVPGMDTVHAPLYLDRALREFSTPDTLLVVDCLSMWLLNWTMPPLTPNAPPPSTQGWDTQRQQFLQALTSCAGPVVLVDSEISLGVIPLGAQVRTFVDTLGLLHQDVAALCDRVTLMVAGLPLQAK